MKLKPILYALFLLTLLWASWSSAQTAAPTPQFAFLGFIQAATLDTTGKICTPAPQLAANGTALDVTRLYGGTITVNGITMIVPCNSIVQLPANTMTWADLFDPASSAPVGTFISAVPANPVIAGQKLGLALTDAPTPFPSFEVSLNGNVVGKNAATVDVDGDGIPELRAGTDRYVVGLIVPVTQQGLNASSGLVSYIDYGIGAFRVGGVANDPACASSGITSPLCSGTLIQFNDPVGRWGLIHSPDPRFSGDIENVTMHTSTGFPLCIPRVAPPGIDAECPLGNRPLNGDARYPIDPFLAPNAPLKVFDMPCPAGAASCPAGQVLADAAGYPDPTKQVPLMIGDQLVYAGTSYLINPLLTRTITFPDGTTTTVPDTSPANTYLSSHTVEDVLGIFTASKVPPAYVTIEEMLIGSGGAAIDGILQEASTRMTVVGFTSDPTSLVDILARDVNPCSGQETLRLLATEDPAVDAIKGRFVHRVLGGLFMPPTRNYTIRSKTQTVDPATGQRVDFIAANGILTGEFSLPLFEYIFPENHRLGDPFLPNNYQDLPFLALGNGPVDGFGTASPIAGQLNPWPGDPVPTPVTCAPGGGSTPVITISPTTIAVGTGAAVTLTGAVSFDSLDNPLSRTSVWTGPVAGTAGGTATAPSYTFIAPSTSGALTFTLTATDNFGTVTGTMIVNVVAAADIVQLPAGLSTWTTQRGKIGPFGKLNVSATSSAAPPAVPSATLTLLETPDDVANGGPTCPLTAPVLGGVCNWGTGAFNKTTDTYDWIESKGAPQPASLTVISDQGGTATVSCSIAKVKTTNVGGVPGTFLSVTCP